MARRGKSLKVQNQSLTNECCRTGYNFNLVKKVDQLPLKLFKYHPRAREKKWFIDSKNSTGAISNPAAFSPNPACLLFHFNPALKFHPCSIGKRGKEEKKTCGVVAGPILEKKCGTQSQCRSQNFHKYVTYLSLNCHISVINLSESLIHQKSVTWKSEISHKCVYFHKSVIKLSHEYS